MQYYNSIRVAIVDRDEVEGLVGPELTELFCVMEDYGNCSTEQEANAETFAARLNGSTKFGIWDEVRIAAGMNALREARLIDVLNLGEKGEIEREFGLPERAEAPTIGHGLSGEVSPELRDVMRQNSEAVDEMMATKGKATKTVPD